MAKKESEIAATTAAAWASWRRIRETGDAKAAPASSSLLRRKKNPSLRMRQPWPSPPVPRRLPRDRALPEPNSDDIAGIVESVLADLRPKIVEEISAKWEKKK